MSATVTVAVPTLNGGARFQELLAAVRAQRIDRELDLLVCDSGSVDGTVAAAEAAGARVLHIERAEFSHGGTRNRLMAAARGEHVAFLTQDAVPISERWLAELLGGFALADDVALCFGPYVARPEASRMTRRELAAWFASLAPDGAPRVDRLAPAARSGPASELFGPVAYFTDANGCVARAAWEEVRFRDDLAYAEDHALAIDMLRAGHAKVYLPGAAVLHSHDYSPWQWLRRSFDETRAVAEVYGAAPGGRPRDALRTVWGTVGADWRAAGRDPRMLVPSTAHHLSRAMGALLGARADRLPAGLTAQLSLEGRRSHPHDA